MKYTLLLFLSLLFFSTQAQTTISQEYLATVTAEEISEDIGAPSQYDVDLYRMLYTTTNLAGELDTASGLVVVPQLDGFLLPMVSYSHGTVDNRFAVPGYLSFEANIPIIYASQGFVVIAADLLGLGFNDGIHPYVHADSEASASYDMLLAANGYLPQEMGVDLNGQLFITGYSQGGHTAMAFHRYLETETDIVVKGAVPMSGPYSISSGMRDLLVGEEEYSVVAYLVAVSLSYQEAYGNIFPDGTVESFFKEEFVGLVNEYLNEERGLFEVNEDMTALLIQNYGGAFPAKMVKDEIVEAILSDDAHPVNVALRDNDVFDWAPKSDTRLLYCMADDQVGFMNSIIARDTMNANGATQVVAIDLNPNFDHGQCVTPAISTMVFYLATFGSQTVNTFDQSIEDVVIAPNPSNGRFSISYDSIDDERMQATVFDFTGQVVYSENISSSTTIDLNVESGIYLLSLRNDKGQVGMQKIVIQK